MQYRISSTEITAIIYEAVDTAIRAGYMQAASLPSDTYKTTERRLYAYPVLQDKIMFDIEKLESLRANGIPDQSKSIVRFRRAGMRLSPDEILDALIFDLSATLAADQYEADTIAGALKTIENDMYYDAVAGKYLRGESDDDIAETIPCDPSTIRRNRGRLIRRLAVWLYGTQAI